MQRIMFVCHGNICRSPMAEYLLKYMVKSLGRENEFVIASSATSGEEIGNDIHPGTKRKLSEEGIPFDRRAAVRLERGDYDKWDIFLGMDSMNLRDILRIFGDDRENRVKRLLDFTDKPRDIADPWYTGDFEKTFNDVVKGCEALLKAL